MDNFIQSFKNWRIIGAFFFVCGLLVTACEAPERPERPAGAESANGSDASAAEASSASDKPASPLAVGDRVLQFQTDEGSWISLDVDPDGEQIVFELLGDLYELPISGGTARAITSGPGYDNQPSISPDGEWIAFISDRDGNDGLWIMRRDGTGARKLSGDGQDMPISPTWSPDGAFVLVAERNGNEREMKLYHRDGGAGLAVTALDEEGKAKAAINGLGGAFSPGGRYIYFTALGQSQGPIRDLSQRQIHRLDRRTGETAEITKGAGGGVRPRISPDGTWLAYGVRQKAQTGLRVRNLQTGEDRMLIMPITRDMQEAGGAPSRDFLPGYAFTPDGRSILIAIDGRIRRVDVKTGEARGAPFSADVKLNVGPDLNAPYRVGEGPVAVRIAHDPQFSPSGDSIAASLLGKIYLKDSNSDASPTRLTNSDQWEFKPAWSPDGRWIAYVTWSDIDGGHIWRIRSNGSGAPERLTEHPAYYTDPVFSPDGRQIFALSGNAWMRSQNFSEFFGLSLPLELIRLPIAGGAAETIASMPETAGKPHFAGDPSRVFVYTDEGLHSMDADGGNRRVRLIVEGPSGAKSGKEQTMPADLVLASPKGDRALALVNGQVWLTALAEAGAETPKAVVRRPAVPAARLTDIGADFIGWLPDGEQVFWAIGSSVFRRAVESVSFAREDDEKKEKKGNDDAGNDADKEEKEKKDEDALKPARDEDPAIERFDLPVSVGRATPRGAFVLRGGRVIAMSGATMEEMTTPIEDADILIVDNKIQYVGPRGSGDIPADAEIFDISGKTVTPGFLDTHAHFEARNYNVLEPNNWTLAANLAYGVTSGLDVQTRHVDYFAYRDFADAGISIGARAFMTGPGVFARTDFQNYNDAHHYLRRYTDHYRTRNIKSYAVGTRKQRQWVVKAAKALGLMPTTEGASDLRLDITHAIDGMHGNEHTLPGARLSKDVTQLYADTKTAYTMTLVVQYDAISAVEYFFPRFNPADDAKLKRFTPPNRLDELSRRRRAWAVDDEFAFEGAVATAIAIQEAGGLVGIGAHGELQGLGYHWEMQAHALGGMTPAGILRAATIDGARIIGVAEDLGSIEPGKLADLVILNDDPLADIANTMSIHRVIKNGVIYDSETLEQLWPDQQSGPHFWWGDSLDDDDDAAAPRP